MAKPKLLMLDEPSLGLAPRIVREVLRIVSELRKLGVSILLVEQNARAALQVADYAYVLETGAVTLEGPAAELAKDPRVIEVYLGMATGLDIGGLLALRERLAGWLSGETLRGTLWRAGLPRTLHPAPHRTTSTI